MSTKMERLQQLWHKYDAEQDHKPTSAREAVEWAVAEGLLELPEVDPYDVLAGQMSQALREEYSTDGQGRRYRVNHAVALRKRECNIHFGQRWDLRRMSTWRELLRNVVNKLWVITFNSKLMLMCTTT